MYFSYSKQPDCHSREEETKRPTFAYKNLFLLVKTCNAESESGNEHERSVRRGKTLYKLSSFT